MIPRLEEKDLLPFAIYMMTRPSGKKSLVISNWGHRSPVKPKLNEHRH